MIHRRHPHTHLRAFPAGWPFLLGLSGLALLCVTSGLTGTVWTENTFEDFRDGEFLDAGSNLYVSAGGRIQMINRWDLNNDGHPDLVIPAGHGHTEHERTFVYLNKAGDIDGRTRIELPGN